MSSRIYRDLIIVNLYCLNINNISNNLIQKRPVSAGRTPLDDLKKYFKIKNIDKPVTVIDCEWNNITRINLNYKSKYTIYLIPCNQLTSFFSNYKNTTLRVIYGNPIQVYYIFKYSSPIWFQDLKNKEYLKPWSLVMI